MDLRFPRAQEYMGAGLEARSVGTSLQPEATGASLALGCAWHLGSQGKSRHWDSLEQPWGVGTTAKPVLITSSFPSASLHCVGLGEG